jgi:hypothetical protein
MGGRGGGGSGGVRMSIDTQGGSKIVNAYVLGVSREDGKCEARHTSKQWKI